MFLAGTKFAGHPKKTPPDYAATPVDSEDWDDDDGLSTETQANGADSEDF